MRTFPPTDRSKTLQNPELDETRTHAARSGRIALAVFGISN